MSILQFLSTGGLANLAGDLSEIHKDNANEIIKKFANKVRNYGRQLQISASLLGVQQCNYLFIAKDLVHVHFVFANVPGQNTINYRDLSAHGRLELQTIARQVHIEVGTPIWAFPAC